jgi:hypothetical protein
MVRAGGGWVTWERALESAPGEARGSVLELTLGATEAPGSGEALQLVLAAILEREAGPPDQAIHCVGRPGSRPDLLSYEIAFSEYVKGARTAIRLLISPSVPSRPRAHVDPLAAPSPAPSVRLALRSYSDGAGERGPAPPAAGAALSGRHAVVPSERPAVPGRSEQAPAEGPVVGVPGHAVPAAPMAPGPHPSENGHSEAGGNLAGHRSARSAGARRAPRPREPQVGLRPDPGRTPEAGHSASARRRSEGSSEPTGSDRLPDARDRPGRSP